MSAHPFNELKAEYERDISLVRPTKKTEIDKVARRLTKPSTIAHYQEVQDKLGIPIVVQACICERESGSDFSRSPAQGDRWDRKSKNVPRGRGPFSSWFESAIDAFHTVDHLDDNSAPWSLAYACWKWEAYNGFGYRGHGVRSPYLVGGTNLQEKGKYTSDGHFDGSEMDGQLGCLPIALRMIELMPSLAFGPQIAPVPGRVTDADIPLPGPVPDAVGGNLTGVKWVQDSLNKILQLAPKDKLDVDGSFGRLTRAALRTFQQSVPGLKVDGLVTDETTAAMDVALAALK
jgi:lysozyme family protein